MSIFKVGLIGFGTIGAGVAKLLLGKEKEVQTAVGHTIKLVKICDKDLATDRGVDLPEGILTDNLSDILDNKEIDIVIELIGGLEPARTFVLKALRAGKNVVTANKALLANHGPELFEEARLQKKTIAYEAAVGGGIPILASIGTSLQANRIESIQAILNGTCNFILSQMEGKGTDYQDAVREAQRLGYAEANPAMDVEGIDTVQKLTILAQLAFGASVNWKEISCKGIDSVSAIDIQYAEALSCRIRLIADARRTEEGLELKVAPTLVPFSSPLAQVKDAFNAIQVVGDFVGPVFYQGLGAGQRPTASAVCSDVIDTVLGRAAITFSTLNLWGKDRAGILVKPSNDVLRKAYLRVGVEDKTGVMSEISGILASQGISIASIIQREGIDKTNPMVNMILMTHAATEGNLKKAIEKIDRLSYVMNKTVCLGVQG
ncbi:MAG: homoserine dehydrogenase [Planctomycetia bacterium]|nr:homoserine dehydrogenase [Planctomycetia bacterium]